MAKHMDSAVRGQVQFWVESHKSVAWIARSLGGKCAYDAFVEEFGDEGRRFLDALGIRRITASEVTLHPFLLGEKFQRIADKAVLRKNGVKKP